MNKKYKLEFNPKIGLAKQFVRGFETHAEAEAALSIIADYTLFLHDNLLMNDFSNVGCIYRLEDGDWIEVDGDDDIF